MTSRISGSMLEEENPRRVAACLKACQGIPTEALESGILLRLVAACVHIRDARLREILEEMAAPAVERPRRRENETTSSRGPKTPAVTPFREREALEAKEAFG